jgi:hypothetical protein
MRWPSRRARKGQRDEYACLVEQSLAALDAREAAQATLLRLDEASWAVDTDRGVITFTGPGTQAASAPVQVVGTLDPARRSWLWGWDHPSVPASLSEHARLVRAWGEEHAVAELTTRLVPDADHLLARRFAAVACELNQARGVRSCDTGRAVVVVTFGTVTLTVTTTDRDDDWADDLGRLPPVTAPEVVGVVKDWMTEIHRIEARYREDRAAPPPGAPGPDDAEEEVVDRAIADKQPVYEQYWRREDEYHRPCSVGTIRWYDVDAMTDWQVHRLGDDTWRVSYREPMTGPLTLARAYDVRRFPDGLRIVDHLD